MKKHILVLFSLILLLMACTQKPDTLIGDWVADKVNVQFDENHATPELVKQIGEMEKQNTLNISSDSLLIFKGLDETWEGRITLMEGDKLYCNGKLFGQWINGEIITHTNSPLGEIIVRYKKTR